MKANDLARRLNIGLPMPTEGLNRLGLILRRCEEGDIRDVRTPFWDGRPRDEILKRMLGSMGVTGIPLLDELDARRLKRLDPCL